MDPLSLARRITTLPATIQTSTRQRIARSLEQLRIALDLPSRRELSELTTRLEALDARIAGLAAQRVSEMTRVVATLTDGQAEGGEPEAVAAAVAEAGAVADGDADAVAAAVAGADLATLDVTTSVTLPSGGANGANSAAHGGHRHNKKKPVKNRR